MPLPYVDPRNPDRPKRLPCNAFERPAHHCELACDASVPSLDRNSAYRAIDRDLQLSLESNAICKDNNVGAAIHGMRATMLNGSMLWFLWSLKIDVRLLIAFPFGVGECIY